MFVNTTKTQTIKQQIHKAFREANLQFIHTIC